MITECKTQHSAFLGRFFSLKILHSLAVLSRLRENTSPSRHILFNPSPYFQPHTNFKRRRRDQILFVHSRAITRRATKPRVRSLNQTSRSPVSITHSTASRAPFPHTRADDFRESRGKKERSEKSINCRLDRAEVGPGLDRRGRKARRGRVLPETKEAMGDGRFLTALLN